MKNFTKIVDFSSIVENSFFEKSHYSSARLSLLCSIALLVTILSYYIYAESSVVSISILFFLPLLAFSLNDLKVGTILTTVYIVLIFISSRLLHGHFQSFQETLQLLAGVSLFSLLVFIFEYSRKQAYKRMVSTIDRLEELSYKDELTKLYNRHFLSRHILNNQELNNKSVLFCITDIDNFKGYNDCYGHLTGDKTLVQIAQAKKKTFGDDKSHFVIRLGGEEFGGFIFGEDEPQQRVEKFYKALKSLSIEHKDNQNREICTVSIGAVLCDNFNELNFVQLYELADKALYEAKNNGKNQVVYKKYGE